MEETKGNYTELWARKMRTVFCSFDSKQLGELYYNNSYKYYISANFANSRTRGLAPEIFYTAPVQV